MPGPWAPARRSKRTGTLKLVLIIAATSDADRLIDRLVKRGLPATKIASSGGFLRRGSATILSGVEDQEVETVIDLARQECRARKEFVPVQNLPVLGEIGSASEPLEVRVGGATVFVLDVDRFDRF
ncbi:MAG TPA: cyclic-di-AMP receptor [Dehalococcoidia bacterium]|nr:cyclic-di-AMP receptor [Dehalococcoidia bacterium]